jgi:hypothetical protein
MEEKLDHSSSSRTQNVTSSTFKTFRVTEAGDWVEVTQEEMEQKTMSVAYRSDADIDELFGVEAPAEKECNKVPVPADAAYECIHKERERYKTEKYFMGPSPPVVSNTKDLSTHTSSAKVVWEDPSLCFSLTTNILGQCGLQRSSHRGTLFGMWMVATHRRYTDDHVRLLERNPFYLLAQNIDDTETKALSTDSTFYEENQKHCAEHGIEILPLPKPNPEREAHQARRAMDAQARNISATVRDITRKGAEAGLCDNMTQAQLLEDISDDATRTVYARAAQSAEAKAKQRAEKRKSPPIAERPKVNRAVIKAVPRQGNGQQVVDRIVRRLLAQASGSAAALLAWLMVRNDGARSGFSERVRQTALTRMIEKGCVNIKDPLFWACVFFYNGPAESWAVFDLIANPEQSGWVTLVKWLGNVPGWDACRQAARNKELHALFGNTTVYATSSQQFSGSPATVTPPLFLQPPISPSMSGGSVVVLTVFFTDGSNGQEHISGDVRLAMGMNAVATLQSMPWIPHPAPGTSESETLEPIDSTVKIWPISTTISAQGTATAQYPISTTQITLDEVAADVRIFGWSGRIYLEISYQYTPGVFSLRDSDQVYDRQFKISPDWYSVAFGDKPALALHSMEVASSGQVVMSIEPLKTTSVPMIQQPSPPVAINTSSTTAFVVTSAWNYLSQKRPSQVGGQWHLSVLLTNKYVGFPAVEPERWSAPNYFTITDNSITSELINPGVDGLYTINALAGQWITLVWVASNPVDDMTFSIVQRSAFNFRLVNQLSADGYGLYLQETMNKRAHTETGNRSAWLARMWNKLMHALNGNLKRSHAVNETYIPLDDVMKQTGDGFDYVERMSQYFGRLDGAATQNVLPAGFTNQTVMKVQNAPQTSTRVLPICISPYSSATAFLGANNLINTTMPDTNYCSVVGPPPQLGKIEITPEAAEQLRTWAANTSFAARPGSNTAVGIQMGTTYQEAITSTALGWYPQDWALKIHLHMLYLSEMVAGKTQMGIWSGGWGSRDTAQNGGWLLQQPVFVPTNQLQNVNIARNFAAGPPVNWPEYAVPNANPLRGRIVFTLDQQWVEDTSTIVLMGANLFNTIDAAKVIAMMLIMIGPWPYFNFAASTPDQAAGNPVGVYHNSIFNVIPGANDITFVLPSILANLPQVPQAGNWNAFCAVPVPVFGAGPINVSSPGNPVAYDMSQYLDATAQTITPLDWTLFLGLLWEQSDWSAVFDATYPLALSMVYRGDATYARTAAELTPNGAGPGRVTDQPALSQVRPNWFGARPIVFAAGQNWPLPRSGVSSVWLYRANIQQWNLSVLRFIATTTKTLPADSKVLAMYKHYDASLINYTAAIDIFRAGQAFTLLHGMSRSLLNRLFTQDQYVLRGSVNFMFSCFSTSPGATGAFAKAGCWDKLLAFSSGKAWPQTMICDGKTTSSTSVLAHWMINVGATVWSPRTVGGGGNVDCLPITLPDAVFYLDIPKIPECWSDLPFEGQSMLGEFVPKPGTTYTLGGQSTLPASNKARPTDAWDADSYVQPDDMDYWNRRWGLIASANGTDYRPFAVNAVLANYQPAVKLMWAAPGVLAQDILPVLMGWAGSTLYIPIATDAINPVCVQRAAGVQSYLDVQLACAGRTQNPTTVIPRRFRATVVFPSVNKHTAPSWMAMASGNSGGSERDSEPGTRAQ